MKKFLAFLSVLILLSVGAFAQGKRNDITPNKLTVKDTATFKNHVIFESTLSGYPDSVGRAHDADTSQYSIMADTTAKAHVADFSLNLYSDTVTCDVGDSVEVNFVGVSVTSKILVCYQSDAPLTTSQIPVSYGSLATNKFTIYGSAGKKVTYFIVRL